MEFRYETNKLSQRNEKFQHSADTSHGFWILQRFIDCSAERVQAVYVYMFEYEMCTRTFNAMTCAKYNAMISASMVILWVWMIFINWLFALTNCSWFVYAIYPTYWWQSKCWVVKGFCVFFFSTRVYRREVFSQKFHIFGLIFSWVHKMRDVISSHSAFICK